MIAILFYELGEQVTKEQVLALFPKHKAWVGSFVEEQKIMAIGSFTDPLADGMMGMFPNRELAEEFVAKDPFFQEKLIKNYQIKDWAGNFYTSIVR